MMVMAYYNPYKSDIETERYWYVYVYIVYIRQ